MDSVEMVSAIAAVAGGGGGFAGAFAAIKVHIHYINRHQDRQDQDIGRAQASADLAHKRIDDVLRGLPE